MPDHFLLFLRAGRCPDRQDDRGAPFHLLQPQRGPHLRALPHSTDQTARAGRAHDVARQGPAGISRQQTCQYKGLRR
jgi:hypothetical protein